MKPFISTDVQRHEEEPLFTVIIYDIDSPVNYHSYDCLFLEQGKDFNELMEKANKIIKDKL